MVNIFILLLRPVPDYQSWQKIIKIWENHSSWGPEVVTYGKFLIEYMIFWLYSPSPSLSLSLSLSLYIYIYNIYIYIYIYIYSAQA